MKILNGANVGTKPAVDQQFIRSLSTGQEAHSDPACPLPDRRPVDFANIFLSKGS